MGFLKIKEFFLISFIIYIQFIQIQSQNQDENPVDKNENDRKMKELEDLKHTLEINKTFINILIGINIFLFIIIISFTIYEIVKCNHRRKLKELLLCNFSKINNNNINISSKSISNNLKKSSENLKTTVNSFNSSKMIDSIRSSNNEDYYISNNEAQKPAFDESVNSFRERSNSGYEAPVIQDYIENNKEDKILTNYGNKNKEEEEKFLKKNENQKNEEKLTNDGNEINANIKEFNWENPYGKSNK